MEFHAMAVATEQLLQTLPEEHLLTVTTGAMENLRIPQAVFRQAPIQ